MSSSAGASYVMIDASGAVSGVLSPYGGAIGTILREVRGDPAAVREAEARYRAGATASIQAATDVRQVSSRLDRSWSGEASAAYAKASRALTEQLQDTQSILRRQAEGMAAVAQAQLRARQGVERTLQGFEATKGNLLAASRRVPPDRVADLMRQTREIADTYYRAAAGHREALAKVLSEVANDLHQAAGSGQAAKPVTAMNDFNTMYGWLDGCIAKEELGKSGRLRESELKTVAGVSASMATPNQTIMSNAVSTLRNSINHDLWKRVNPPLEDKELVAANSRMREVQQAWNPTVEAFKSERREAEALVALGKRQAALDAAQARLESAVPGSADATKAEASLKLAQQQFNAAQALAQSREKAADLAAGRAQALLADPDRFVRDHGAATGLSANDLKNMLLAGMKAREPGNLTPAELKQMQSLENDLRASNDFRLDEAGKNHPLRTLERFPGEDLAAWQRKGLNSLDAGNGSVGDRINQIAVSDPQHRALTDGFLKAELVAARKRFPDDELRAIRKVVVAQNSRPEYVASVMKCYQAKKAAAEAAAAKK